jgi:hypothetical protein
MERSSASSVPASDVALLDAIRQGRLDDAKSLLDGGANWLATDAEGNTGLHLVAERGAEGCAWFVERGMPVDARNNAGLSPLHVAMIAGQREATAYLLDHGANVNAELPAGYPPWNIPAGAKPLDLARAGESRQPEAATSHRAIAELLAARGGTSNIVPFRWRRILWLPALPVFFVLFFWGLLRIDARITGWSALAERYSTANPAGISITTQDGTVGEWGLVHVKGLMRVDQGEAGLYIAYPGWLSAGHPPLLIPWSELRLKDARDVVGIHVVHLSAGDPELAVVIIRGGKAKEIEQRFQ